ncbi:hypothetical protein, partial [Oenococcus oeni]|uniref:hypothetical protein n=1 Tax=Oenococcus oeni TaxID=1247 RepID=UPI000A7E69D8
VLTNENRQKLLEINHRLAKQALRVLAFAYQNVKEVPGKLTSKAVEKDLVFVGFVAMIVSSLIPVLILLDGSKTNL